MQSKSVIICLVLLCCAAVAGCEPSKKLAVPSSEIPGPASYSAETFYQTTSYRLAAAPAWSADADKLLIGSDKTGTLNVYALNVANGQETALTSSTDNAQRPISWFPGDDRVLLSADSGGNELNHLYVREESGEIRDLTPGDNLKAIFTGWSGDHQHFFLVTNERQPEAFDLYRYSTKNYERELVFRNDEFWSVEAISKDQRYLALRRENSSSDSDIYLLDLKQEGATPQHVTPHRGQVQYYVFGFSPDSQRLNYGTDNNVEFVQSWNYVIPASAHVPMGQFTWDEQYVSYSDSGLYRITGTNEDARNVVQILNTSSGRELTLPRLPAGQLSQLRFSPDETQLAVMVSSDTSPNDLYIVDLKSTETRRMTRALNPALNEADLVGSTNVRYRSFDGLPIPGILYQPKTASAENPVPALVWVHGGPGGQSRVVYSAMRQHLVNQGYALLAVNNRGSSGYGKTFFHLDDRKHGEVDLDDVVYARHFLAKLDWVQPENIGIIGGSYGGYMVGAALAFRPGVFKAGVNIFGVMNWVRTLESVPPYWEAMRKRLYDELGDPAVDGERLRRISPLFHADQIKTPLLVVQGANDPRVLQVESDEIVAAVKANGVPVEYIVFPDEGHGFSHRANRITASEAFVAFFDKYLK